MQKIELTSKLVLAIIGLAAVGAILVPTYAVPTIRSADIFDETILSADIKNGEVKNSDLGTDAVTTSKIKNGEVKAEDIAPGVIPSGGVQPTVHEVRGENVDAPPGSGSPNSVATCPDGEILTGGGYSNTFSRTGPLEVVFSQPTPDTTGWVVGAFNHGTETSRVQALAICLDFTP